jgi:hypothetical protein
MRKLWPILALFSLAACIISPANQLQATEVTTGQPNQPVETESIGDDPTPNKNNQLLTNLEDLGPAPELENDVWVNSEGPLRLENLRGQVVLLEMWTFG